MPIAAQPHVGIGADLTGPNVGLCLEPHMLHSLTMKTALAILAVLLASSCARPTPLALVEGSNESVAVYLIGHIPEHNCDIYLINPQGLRERIITICPDVTPTSAEHTASCGKNCTTEVEEHVVRAPRK